MEVSRHAPCVLASVEYRKQQQDLRAAEAEILKGAQNPGFRGDPTQRSRVVKKKRWNLQAMQARDADESHVFSRDWVRLAGACQKCATIPVDANEAEPLRRTEPNERGILGRNNGRGRNGDNVGMPDTGRRGRNQGRQ